MEKADKITTSMFEAMMKSQQEAEENQEQMHLQTMKKQEEQLKTQEEYLKRQELRDEICVFDAADDYDDATSTDSGASPSNVLYANSTCTTTTARYNVTSPLSRVSPIHFAGPHYARSHTWT